MPIFAMQRGLLNNIAVPLLLMALVFGFELIGNSGLARANGFSNELQQLQQKNPQQFGRESIVGAYEQLIKDYPTHPDRAQAMLDLASLWMLENPKKKIDQNKKASVLWLRKACKAARPGTKDWLDAMFRLEGEIRWEKPEEGRSILAEITKNAPDSSVEAHALYALQGIAAHEKKYDEAEKISETLQRWYRDPSHVLKDIDRKSDTDGWIQSSGSDMIMTWAHRHGTPKAERIAKIKAFADEHSQSQGIDRARGVAIKLLENKANDPLDSKEAPQANQSSQ
ncbi:MAG: tetratricopeptide repeat protein [Planctomycetota bacterium]|nr:tetratricopeptide repeat protein [Planctomycetota bacterium]